MVSDYELDKTALSRDMISYVQNGRPHFDTVEMIERVFREQSISHYRTMEFARLAVLLASAPELGSEKIVLTHTSHSQKLSDLLASALGRIVADDMSTTAVALSFDFWDARIVGVLSRYCEVARQLSRLHFESSDSWWADDLEEACELLEAILDGRRELNVDLLIEQMNSSALVRALESSRVYWLTLDEFGIDRPLVRRIADALANFVRLSSEDPARFSFAVSKEMAALGKEGRGEYLAELRRTALPVDAQDLRRLSRSRPA